MKKIFVTVLIFAAMAATVNAASNELDNLVVETQTQVTNPQSASAEEDIYRTYALQSEENDRHIIRFYDVDRIVVRNQHHALIRIYDDKWRLIEQTREDVDKDVRAGNYYITSSTHIKGSYKM